MYKNELFKVIKTKVFFIFVFVIIIILGLSGLFFESYSDGSTFDSYYGVLKYESIDDLRIHYNNNETHILDLKESFNITNSSRRRQIIEQQIEIKEKLSMIYQYLIDNPEIKYEQYYDYGSINDLSNQEALSFFSYLTNYALFIIIFGMAIISSLIVVNDFSNGTYKFLYTSNVSRTKMVLIKYSVTTSISIALTLLITLIGISGGLIAYGIPDKIVIFASNSNVFSVNWIGYTILIFINYIQIILLISSIIFFLSLFFKSNLISIIIAVVFLFLTIVAYDLFENITGFLSKINIFILINNFDAFSSNPLWDNLWGYIIISLIYLIIISISGVLWFKYKDFN